MESDTYGELLQIAENPGFSVLQCIDLVRKHGNNIGVHHYLVKKLYRFSYLEVEFYVPQLVQIMVSYETDSMALSDFLLDYSGKYPHFCLVTFWNLQAYIFELKNDPESFSFHVVRNFINELQNIMFNQENYGEASWRETASFRENLLPALVLSGAIGTSFALPAISPYIKPVVHSQGKQQKSLLFRLANFHKTLTKNLTMKNRGRIVSGEDEGSDRENSSFDTPRITGQNDSKGKVRTGPFRKSEELSATMSMPDLDPGDDPNYHSDYTLERKMNINTKIISKKSLNKLSKLSDDSLQPLVESSLDAFYARPHIKDNQPYHSMPDLRTNNEVTSMEDMALTPMVSDSSSTSLVSLDLQEHKPSSHHRLIPLHHSQKVKFLHVLYFKKETEFMMGLQNVSMRLSLVPKEARLTSLRAELSIINNTLLPAEIDIPQLLPISSKQNKFHRILKLNVNEACVLNSAERVPYLLLIEYLSEDMDFDPSTEYNKHLIMSKGNSEAAFAGRRNKASNIDSPRHSAESHTPQESTDIRSSILETDLGDMSVVELSNEQSFMSKHITPGQTDVTNLKGFEGIRISREDGGGVGGGGYSGKENDSPNLSFEGRRSTSGSLPSFIDTKDLSTQMRIAAVMLQQLEKSSQPNSEQSLAIKARIIELMKSLQDKFERIDYELIRGIQHSNERVSTDAGERKLENDFKLSEDWATKKNRIRLTSAYGHLKNWDLCSVIAKNGDDLPQEAFACQLITIISNIWKANNVKVITKSMKILITSANSGLVETINNAMSIHSIKKTLTDLSLKQGENPRGKVASLKDYFLKVYENEDSYKYKKAQDNFARSLAAYSIICYVLQIKDRHNGNIMLDSEGHIIHIDFGFLLSNSPGSVGFEAAPFKLTFEYIEVLGGMEGSAYKKFEALCKECFKVLKQNSDQLINIVEIMQKDSGLPCFKNGEQTSVFLKQRLQPDLKEDDECDAFVENMLIGKSLGSVYTRLYDQFQLLTQGIYN